MINPNEHVHQYVDDYVHDLLSADEKAMVEQHCRQCAKCQSELQTAQQRLNLLQSIPPEVATEQLIQSTLEQTRCEVVSKRNKPVADPHRIRPRTVKWIVRFWIGIAASALIIAGFNAYFLSLGPGNLDLVIYGQNELIADSTGSVRVRFYNRQSNRPIQNASVELELEGEQPKQYIRLASFHTDANGSGSPQLHLPAWPDGEYQLTVNARKGRMTESITRTISLKRSWKLMLSTDKPVYQPGQTIRMRSLALRKPDKRPVAGEEVIFSVHDPKGNVIFKERSVASQFGIASADCELATELIEGAYQINCSIGDTQSNRTVDVKKYVLPKFQLSLACNRPYYSPGEIVQATIDAHYFFGKPVAGGEVELKVKLAGFAGANIHQLTTQLDQDGKRKIKFRIPERLPGSPLDEGDAEIEMELTVTDSAEQKIQRLIKKRVTNRPLRVEILPEFDELVAGVSNRIFLFTTYADGQPASTHVSVSGFPTEVKTNELGVAVLELTPQEDSTTLTVRARDETGLSVNRNVSLATESSDDRFIIRTDEVVYQSGDTLQLTVLGKSSSPVFVDLIKDRQTITTQTIEVVDGSGLHHFDLPAELNGVIELCAYRFSTSGLPIRKTRTLFVNQADDVAIEATFDKQQYRPGGQARLRLKLTDSEGRPQTGAVSLAVVDEAVYSVLAGRPGSEQTFFTLQNELLKPVYQIYDWVPHRLNSVNMKDQQLLDEALYTRAKRANKDREKQLQHLVDNYLDSDRSILDVLQRPDWEELIDLSWLPQDAIDLLKGKEAVHSLTASSYPAKSRAIIKAKRRGLSRVQGAWSFLGFISTIGLFVTVIRMLTRNGFISLVEWVVLFLIVGVLIAMLMPAVQQAREALNRTSIMNDVKQIALAAANQKSAAGGVKKTFASRSGAVLLPRTREWFPETLLWRPELITNDQGEIVLDVDLADSITTWRMAASAVTAEGQLGALEKPLRVFQPFFVDVNLPTALTRQDEISVPVVVYNYLKQPQTVGLSLTESDWFELLDPKEQELKLEPGEVKSIHYRIRANQVGQHELTVSAIGSHDQAADAVRRQIEVVPNGQPVEQVLSGTLDSPAEMELAVRQDVIPGSVKTIVKIYPSTFSQVLQGLEGIFQRPSGCFEQTSSTTYPNILALQYLRQTGQNMPAVEIAARQYIHLGYQRLLTFEVQGGGFEWFGNPPANTVLTAYGLMEFEDMSQVHQVDPKLIERTRQWLLNRRLADGSWKPESHAMHSDPAHTGAADSLRLATTAYLAWSIYSSQKHGTDAGADKTLDYLLSHRPADIQSPYLLALMCNAIEAIDDDCPGLKPYLSRLLSMRKTSADGETVWWEQGSQNQTMFFGAGTSGNIETTAMSILALLATDQEPVVVRKSLAWLIQQKDRHGTWHSTQATVLSLKALLAGIGKIIDSGQPRSIEVFLDDQLVHEIVIPADQSDVVQQYQFPTGTIHKNHRLLVKETEGNNTAFQILHEQYIDSDVRNSVAEPLTISVDYDRTTLLVQEEITAVATIKNNLNSSAPMVVMDLPIPPGFSIVGDEFERAVGEKEIEKYELTSRSVIIYLRQLQSNQKLRLKYRLRATMPVEITVPAPQAYHYYDPDQQAEGKTDRIIVTSSNEAKRDISSQTSFNR